MDATLARRRRVVLIALGVAVLLVAVGVIVSSLVRTADTQPLPGGGLLAWPPRGGMVEDRALVDAAQTLWRGGTDVDGETVALPGEHVHLLWADRIGAGRVVIMEAIGADAKPYVAQASEQGDPAVLGLDAVEELPTDRLIALAVTYDGNLHIAGIEPGVGSALIQLLPEPPETSDNTGLWRYVTSFANTGLERLELKSSGMSETFLQLDVSDPAGTAVVVATTVGANAGVAGTLAVRGGRLVPGDARIALADDPAWGSSGRIRGDEFTALTFAALKLEMTDVKGFVAAREEITVSGTAPSGVVALVSLVVLETPDEPSRVACVLTDGSDKEILADTVLADPDGVDLDLQRVLAGSCPFTFGSVARAVAIAASRPGAGEVVLEADGRLLAGPSESVVALLEQSVAADSLVARLDGDDGTGSSFLVEPVAP